MKLRGGYLKGQGFSLIEVVVALGIIAIIGLISMGIFTQTLRTSKTTTDLSNLKQTGEAAVSILSEEIRNAESVICYGPPDNTYATPFEKVKDIIVIRKRTGTYTKLRFVPPTFSSGQITANGYIARQENLNPDDLASFCNFSFTPALETVLTNNDLVSGVSINRGEFIAIKGLQNKDTVTIKFYINPTKTFGLYGWSGTTLMQTTVQVR